MVVDDTTTGKAHRSAVEKIRSEFAPNLTFNYVSLAEMSLVSVTSTTGPVT